MPRYSVVQVRPGREPQYASETGAEVPLVERKWVYRGKNRTGLFAEYPGYAFVTGDVDDPVRYYELKTKDFYRVLPGKVTQTEYDRLHEDRDERGVRKQKNEDKLEYFAPGDVLEIINGPMIGLKVICKYHRKEKVCVTPLQGSTQALHMHSSSCIKAQ